MASDPSSKRTVLLIDDDEAIRMTLRFILEDHGYQVEEAGDGLEGLTLIESGHKPDLIILDLMMPRMDGWEFSQRYHERVHEKDESPAPIVVISAFRDRPMPTTAVAVLPKPFTMSSILEIIRRFAP